MSWKWKQGKMNSILPLTLAFMTCEVGKLSTSWVKVNREWLANTFYSKWLSHCQKFAVSIYWHFIIQKGFVHDEGVKFLWIIPIFKIKRRKEKNDSLMDRKVDSWLLFRGQKPGQKGQPKLGSCWLSLLITPWPIEIRAGETDNLLRQHDIFPMGLSTSSFYYY